MNTLVRNGDTWHGDNTDGAGLVRDLTDRHALDLRARRTLLLGAGGAARGVAPACSMPASANCTSSIARPSAPTRWPTRSANPAACIRAISTTSPSLGEFDLIINATSAARDGQIPALPRSLVGRRCAAVDLSYGEAAIPFLAWARAAGCHDVVDGLGMLVEQAAESFARWHGVRPETDAVYAMLRVAPRRVGHGGLSQAE